MISRSKKGSRSDCPNDKLDRNTISGQVAHDGHLTARFRQLASALNKWRKYIVYLRYNKFRDHWSDVGTLKAISQVVDYGIYISAFVGTNRRTEHGIIWQRRLLLSALRRSTHLSCRSASYRGDQFGC